MADRSTGAGMRKSLLNAPVREASNTLTGFAKLIQNTTQTMAADAINEYGKAKVKEAEEAGALAGYEEKPEDIVFRDKTKLSGEAFNKAAAKTMRTKQLNMATMALNDIKMQYGADPGKYKIESDKLIKATKEQFVKNSATKALGHEIEATMQLKANTDGNAVTKAWMVEQSKIHKANVEDNIDAFMGQVDTAGNLLYSSDVNDTVQALTDFDAKIIEVQAEMMAVDPLTGKPLYKESEIQETTRQLKKSFHKTAIIEMIQDQDIDPAKLSDIIDGTYEKEFEVGGKVYKINPMAELGADEYKTVRAQAKAALAFSVKKAESDDKKQKDATKMRHSINYNRTVMEQTKDPFAYTFNELTIMAEAGKISPTQLSKLTDNIGKISPVKSNPNAQAKFLGRVAAGDLDGAAQFMHDNSDQFSVADQETNMGTLEKNTNEVDAKKFKTLKANIEDEFMIRDGVTGLPVVGMQTVVNDAIQVYQNNTTGDNPMTEELALEFLKEDLTDYRNNALSNSAESWKANYSKYMKNNQDGTTNFQWSYDNINMKLKDGKLTQEMAIEAMNGLNYMYALTQPAPEPEPQAPEPEKQNQLLGNFPIL